VLPISEPVLRREISAVLPPAHDRIPAVMAFCDELRAVV
jgi:hypothetical protein